MAVELGIDQRFAPALGGLLRAQIRASVTTPAEPSDAEFRARRQVRAHGTGVLQDVRVCFGGGTEDGEGDEGGGDLEKTPDFGEDAAAGVHECFQWVHVRGVGTAAPEQVGEEDFAPGAGGVAVGEDFVVDEFQTEEIGEIENGGFGIGIAGNVGFRTVESLHVAGWLGMIVDRTPEAIWARHG